MVAASKLFVEHFSYRSCNDLLHPHSCARSALQNLWRFTWSNGKYYLPVALLHMLKHSLRGFNIVLLQNSLRYYAELIFGGLVNACLISTSMCVLRQLLGEFRLYTLLFLPATFGGAFIAFLPHRVKQLQHTAIFQALIESLLLQRGNPLTRTLASSLPLQALLFMCCSSIILLGKQRRWHQGFWFLTPENITKDTSARANYVLQGVRKYLLIGFALDSFKALISCVKSGNWQLKQLRLESMAFLGCYVGIYRMILCYLEPQKAINVTVQQMLASFLGGISYLCYPKRTILSYALLQTGCTLWGSCHRKPRRKRFDYSDLIFPLALAYLIHTYVLQPSRVSSLTGIIVDSTTANYARNISKRLQQLHPGKDSI